MSINSIIKILSIFKYIYKLFKKIKSIYPNTLFFMQKNNKKIKIKMQKIKKLFFMIFMIQKNK